MGLQCKLTRVRSMIIIVLATEANCSVNAYVTGILNYVKHLPDVRGDNTVVQVTFDFLGIETPIHLYPASRGKVARLCAKCSRALRATFSDNSTTKCSHGGTRTSFHRSLARFVQSFTCSLRTLVWHAAATSCGCQHHDCACSIPLPLCPTVQLTIVSCLDCDLPSEGN